MNFQFATAVCFFFLSFSVQSIAAENGIAEPIKSAPTQTSTTSTPRNGKMSLKEETQPELTAVLNRLASLEGLVSKSSEQADNIAFRTSVISFFSVLAGGLLAAVVGLSTQAWIMKNQRILNRNDAADKVTNTFAEWQLQQLAELYAPLRALLGQSNVLYRQMNKALVAADPNRFRLVKGVDFDNLVFEIHINNEWIRFRTVKHLAEVYGKNYGVEPYFDDVVDVGARIADLIQKSAGFARQEDNELIKVMSYYLAHFFTLKRMLEKVKNNSSQTVSRADEEATFPIEIQNLVDVGFKTINAELIQWRNTKNSSH